MFLVESGGEINKGTVLCVPHLTDIPEFVVDGLFLRRSHLINLWAILFEIRKVRLSTWGITSLTIAKSVENAMLVRQEGRRVIEGNIFGETRMLFNGFAYGNSIVYHYSRLETSLSIVVPDNS